MRRSAGRWDGGSRRPDRAAAATQSSARQGVRGPPRQRPTDIFHVEVQDKAQLDYRSVNVPDDLDPGALLAGPLAPLALWSYEPPPDVAERVVDRIAVTGPLEEQLVQIELGMLVGGPLAEQFLEALRGRGMNDVLEQSESGREIFGKGQVDGMRRLLRAKYGDLHDLDDLAQRLTASDYDKNIARIVADVTVEELRS
ncbi:hypothetical protein OWR29_09985 [Actinoplanes sp. Pm04-4]|uniref:Uncharacterized protein n=1 Tax=Paractinoplanes pyxinae TaxID=2997416 RepID=A0ABT4AWS5_9ACTN|nr:hypothetical protein [Actinoplanes pyxinae]MCY1138327.1 hypothetical protein [Actinoplanes pyxinae]